MKTRSSGSGTFATILLFLGSFGLVSSRLDAGVDFSQCSNKNPTLGNCVWVGGDLNKNNSSYFEGMSTPQRILLTGLGTGTHHLQIVLKFMDSSKHSYDWMVSWPQASTESAAATGTGFTFNECANLSVANTTACNNILAALQSSSADVPDGSLRQLHL
jgi:hypothetical protein